MKSVNNRKNSPYAVVIGLDNYLGLQTARILSRRGVPVIGIAGKSKQLGWRTNVCEKILFADTDSDDLIGVLSRIGQGLEQKAVLIPCNDITVLIISRHRQVLEPYYLSALPQPEKVEMLMNKLSFYKYALNENLPIAKTYILHSRADAEKAVHSLTFPCVLKPSVKTPTWQMHTNFKAYKIFSKKDFFTIYDQCSKWAEVLIIQEWVTGTDANCYACNCYFNTNSEPIVTFVCRSFRKWYPETGNTSLGQECRNDFVLNESIHLFKKVGLQGLGYLEMKQDERTGKYYIIEPNIGRPTGKSALAEACGVELLYTMYCDKVGWPLPEKIKQKYIGVKWIYLRFDLQSALYYWIRGNLTIREWWRSLRGPKTYAVFSWSDPLPFFEDIRIRIMSQMSFVFTKLLRLLSKEKHKQPLNSNHTKIKFKKS